MPDNRLAPRLGLVAPLGNPIKTKHQIDRKKKSDNKQRTQIFFRDKEIY